MIQYLIAEFFFFNIYTDKSLKTLKTCVNANENNLKQISHTF